VARSGKEESPSSVPITYSRVQVKAGYREAVKRHYDKAIVTLLSRQQLYAI
jgi:hypothetical protein